MTSRTRLHQRLLTSILQLTLSHMPKLQHSALKSTDVNLKLLLIRRMKISWRGKRWLLVGWKTTSKILWWKWRTHGQELPVFLHTNLQVLLIASILVLWRKIYLEIQLERLLSPKHQTPRSRSSSKEASSSFPRDLQKPRTIHCNNWMHLRWTPRESQVPTPTPMPPITLPMPLATSLIRPSMLPQAQPMKSSTWAPPELLPPPKSNKSLQHHSNSHHNQLPRIRHNPELSN